MAVRAGQRDPAGAAGFASPYQGKNSLAPDDHAEVSFVATIFGGYEITPTTTVVVTGESAGGSLGKARGENLEVEVRDTVAGRPGSVRLLGLEPREDGPLRGGEPHDDA